MKLLGDDDLDLRELSDEELERAWDLWFDLAQETNDFDPPYEHGVFQLVQLDRREGAEDSHGAGDPALRRPDMRG